jgi:hypothetical protein
MMSNWGRQQSQYQQIVFQIAGVAHIHIASCRPRVFALLSHHTKSLSKNLANHFFPTEIHRRPFPNPVLRLNHASAATRLSSNFFY